MDAAQNWQTLFSNWPADMPRQGLIVTTFNEAIPFTDFLVSEGIVIIQRDKPDSLGSRKAMIAYPAIAAVKLTDPGDIDVYTKMGFQRGGAQAPTISARPSLPQMPRRPLVAPTV